MDNPSKSNPPGAPHPVRAAAVFAARLRSWGVDDDSLLLAYDESNGMWAARFWWMTAKWLGHTQVAVLQGGLSRWRSLDLPVTTALPPFSVIRMSPETDAFTSSRNPLRALCRGLNHKTA